MIKVGKKVGLTAFILVLIVTAILVVPVEAQTTRQIVRIKADGSFDPASAPIQRNGNIYTFTDNINAEIRVEKEGITIDGAGYTLMGPYNGSQTLWIIGEGPNQTPTGDAELWSIGIDTVTDTINDLTIKNLNVKNFSIGMYMWTKHNLVTGNAISNCIVGILLSGNDNTFTQNYIADNKNGVYFGSNEPGNIPVGVLISDNCFVDNLSQLSGCVCEEFNNTEEIHTWDNGARGNFWSDYIGTDSNGDGIGDAPYTIDLLNQDRFPLIQNQIVTPTPTPKQQTGENIIPIAAIAGAVAVVVVAVIFTLKRKRTQTAKHTT